MKFLLIIMSAYLLSHAQTPFILTNVKEVYPLVGIYTDKVPLTYRQRITDIISKYAKELGMDTKGYSPRPLGIIVSRVAVGKTLVLKVALIMGEEVRRLDDNEEVFALTYQKVDIVEIENLEVDLIDSVEFLLEEFKEQYIEDNEK